MESQSKFNKSYPNPALPHSMPRLIQLEKMRSGLAAQFESTLLEVQQRMGLRTLLVERKLAQLAQLLEAREAQVTQLVTALESDPATVELARGHLEVSLSVAVYSGSSDR